MSRRMAYKTRPPTEKFHHVPAGIGKDEHIPAAESLTHSVRHDAAEPVEALAHINGLVVQPVPAGVIQIKHCWPL